MSFPTLHEMQEAVKQKDIYIVGVPNGTLERLLDISVAAQSVYAGLTCAQDPMDVDERIDRLGVALKVLS